MLKKSATTRLLHTAYTIEKRVVGNTAYAILLSERIYYILPRIIYDCHTSYLFVCVKYSLPVSLIILLLLITTCLKWRVYGNQFRYTGSFRTLCTRLSVQPLFFAISRYEKPSDLYSVIL